MPHVALPIVGYTTIDARENPRKTPRKNNKKTEEENKVRGAQDLSAPSIFPPTPRKSFAANSDCGGRSCVKWQPARRRPAAHAWARHRHDKGHPAWPIAHRT